MTGKVGGNDGWGKGVVLLDCFALLCAKVFEFFIIRCARYRAVRSRAMTGGCGMIREKVFGV